MTLLRKLIARFGGFEQLATVTENQFTSVTEGGHSRVDSMWDEALMASVHCETARTYLDCMGPRWK